MKIYNSIIFKIPIIALVLYILLLGPFYLYVNHETHKILTQQTEKQINLLTDYISWGISTLVEHDALDKIQFLASNLNKYKFLTNLVILNNDLEILAATNKELLSKELLKDIKVDLIINKKNIYTKTLSKNEKIIAIPLKTKLYLHKEKISPPTLVAIKINLSTAAILKKKLKRAQLTQNLLIILIFTSMLVFILLKQVLLPIKQSIKNINDFKLKKTFSLNNIGRNDEIGLLCQSFNMIATEILDHEKKLTISNNSLDKRIKEKTEDLQSCNRILKAQSNWFATILNSVGDALIITDEQGFITMINPTAQKTTGWSEAEVLGKNTNDVLNLVNAYTKKKIQSPIEKILKEKTTIALDSNTILITKDGNEIPIDNNGAPIIDNNGKILGVVLVFRDITPKKQLEMQLTQAQKFEAIGTLAAGIAHEINTPIQFLGDNTTFIKEAYDYLFELVNMYREFDNFLALNHKKKYEAIRSYEDKKDIDLITEEMPLAIKSSMEAIYRIREIVKSIKEFSRFGVKEEMILSDINKAINSTVTISRSEWKYVAEMQLELQPDLPLTECFIGSIKQAILNLIINAAQAIKEKELLTLGAIKIKTEKLNNKILIKISDTGPGIPKKIQEKIYDPFFTTKEVGVGTGQGLYIVYSAIVKEHHGSIKLDTKLNEGTTFTIELPIKSSEYLL